MMLGDKSKTIPSNTTADRSSQGTSCSITAYTKHKQMKGEKNVVVKTITDANSRCTRHKQSREQNGSETQANVKLETFLHDCGREPSGEARPGGTMFLSVF